MYRENPGWKWSSMPLSPMCNPAGCPVVVPSMLGKKNKPSPVRRLDDERDDEPSDTL